MDALERVKRLSRASATLTWEEDDFRRAAAEGKRRWQEVEESLGIQYSMFQDAVAELDPSFQLTSEEQSLARSADVPARRNVNNRIAVWFLKWERCPLTRGLPNPYEPWISIWEHGGSFSVEHGQFVDIYDQTGMPLGGVVVRRA
jgi:hypothetical protein